MAILRLTLVAVGGLALAYPVLIEGRSAAVLARGNVIAAVAMRPNSPAALSELAVQFGAAGRNGDAVGAAADALRAAPLDQRAARLLGVFLMRTGRPEEARSALTLAGGLGWRDNPTLEWMMRDATARGDWAAALVPADAMARRRRAPASAFATIRRVAFAEGGTERVATVLREPPPWREDFLNDVASLRPDDFASFGRLLTAARATRAERRAFVDRLVASGDYAAARRIWDGAGAREGDAAALSAEDFSRFDPQGGSPFEWRAGGGDVAATRVNGGRQDRPVLRIEGSASFSQPVVTQTATAAPGARVLTVDRRAEDADAPLTWSIVCLPGGAALPLSSNGAAALTAGWQRAAWRFEVPATGCGAQRVTLSTRGSTAGGRFDAMIDRVTIR